MERITRKDLKDLKDHKLRTRILKNEKKIEETKRLNKINELVFRTEDAGYLEAEGIEKTFKYTQEHIHDAIDINTQHKIFKLDLPQLGPYKIDYTRNGRHLLIGGSKGHVASFDWKSGKLGCEIQLGESIRDIKWLHNEMFFAVAQKKYVYIYDHTGMEVHQLKKHIDVTRMEFLPYHFLLATVGHAGYLHYQDTSTGELVAEIPTRMGSCNTMCQNRSNAIIHLGHNNGVVSLWSPNNQKPLVKMLSHNGKVQSLAVDHSGRHMTTSGLDGFVKVWDLRMYKQLYSYNMHRSVSNVAISQKGLVAISSNSYVNVFKDFFVSEQDKPYMTHLQPSCVIESMQFCPFDDVLGLGHAKGISSIIVPGSGEPNFDGREANPYQTTKQRQEMEVHSLLDKIQPDMIGLDPDFIGNMNKTAAEFYEEEERKIEKTPIVVKKRNRAKNAHIRKQIKRNQNIIDEKKEMLKSQLQTQKPEIVEKEYSALDRFRTKR